MFITRECDYAVRVVRALKGTRKLSVNEICEKEDITAPFAYKILNKLQKASTPSLCTSKIQKIDFCLDNTFQLY